MGLGAMHASTAYASGYHGQGVKVGVMDSGALLQKHPELSGDRFTAASAKGEYGSDGNRYPQEVGSDGQGGLPYHKGDKFDIDGNWTEGVNDSHGTHVTGTVGGNRDGNEFHGVAWGADIVVGNTGATDNNNYGPFQDYAYFKAAWTGVAEEVAKANGERGGVINNSWGTNIRTKEVYKWSAEKEDWVWDHYVAPDEDTSKYATGDVPKKPADGQCYHADWSSGSEYRAGIRIRVLLFQEGLW